METVGVRGLKNRLGYYVGAVRNEGQCRFDPFNATPPRRERLLRYDRSDNFGAWRFVADDERFSLKHSW